MNRSEATKKQIDKAQRHHTQPSPDEPRKGDNGQGVVRTERGEDQPMDKKRARKNR